MNVWYLLEIFFKICSYYVFSNSYCDQNLSYNFFCGSNAQRLIFQFFVTLYVLEQLRGNSSHAFGFNNASQIGEEIILE
jgi:hypothetical protein